MIKDLDYYLQKQFKTRSSALEYIKQLFPSPRTTHTKQARALLKLWFEEKREYSFREIEIRSLKSKIPIRHFQKAAQQLKLTRQSRGFGKEKTSYWSK